MERQRRQADSENSLWGNPCDYESPNTANVPDPKDVAPKLIAQAKNAITSTAKYKDAFAQKLHSYDSFDDLISTWDGNEWLRKFNLPEQVLPKEKVLYKDVPNEYLDKLMPDIDKVLPSMYKALKLIVAGLYGFSNEGLNDSIIADESLRDSINNTMHDVRAVLCHFNNIMKGRKLEILPLPNSEAPDFTPDNMLTKGLLLYRDTLNYLEYLVQVFQKLY